MNITNKENIALPLAVWAASDDYDYDDDPAVISTTALLKPVRAVVLSARAPKEKSPIDVLDLLASSMGTAIHNDIESAWVNNYKMAMSKLGYTDAIIARIRINPAPSDLNLHPEIIPIYLEQRKKRALGKYIISGKFDKVIEGKLNDYKSTSTWGWIFGSNIEDYTIQMSIYRWLNTDIVTQDNFDIHYIFTDWSASKAKQDKTYPQQRVKTATYPLMSLEATENWLTNRLAAIEANMSAPNENLPLCTPKELWQKDAVYKYYKDPKKKTRSTKNFASMAEAMTRLHADNSVGEIVTVPGEVKRCHYCSARPACTQAENLAASGELIL